MSGFFLSPLWAVHISDGLLRPSWEWGGLALAGLLALFGAWRIRDEEVPRVALLAAAFFVASQMHIRVPGAPTTTHLLLNGLLGVVLGRRALLAIPVGLLLQKVLFDHGGYWTLGVNACVLGLPALAAWLLFAALRRLPWLLHPGCRAALVAVSVFLFGLTFVYGGALLLRGRPADLSEIDLSAAHRLVVHPATLVAVVLLAAGAAWVERRLENAPEFPLGLVVGEATVLLTVLLNSLALLLGGAENWHGLALVNFLIHLPLAVLEGGILGFTVGFLVRVKPEMLGWATAAPEEKPCPVESLS